MGLGAIRVRAHIRARATMFTFQQWRSPASTVRHVHHREPMRFGTTLRSLLPNRPCDDRMASAETDGLSQKAAGMPKGRAERHHGAVFPSRPSNPTRNASKSTRGPKLCVSVAFRSGNRTALRFAPLPPCGRSEKHHHKNTSGKKKAIFLKKIAFFRRICLKNPKSTLTFEQ